MLDPHIGDLAELYVLGDLGATDVAALEEHIAVCAGCLRRVGEAEETVLALERGDVAAKVPALLERRLLLPAPKRLPFAGLAAAAAAGIVVGILATFLSLSSHTNDTQHALLAMVNSHFNHAQFAPVDSASAPPAKVIYARDKSWLYVIATGSERYSVFTVGPNGATRLGELQPQGSSSTLFVKSPFNASVIELRDGSTIIARATAR